MFVRSPWPACFGSQTAVALSDHEAVRSVGVAERIAACVENDNWLLSMRDVQVTFGPIVALNEASLHVGRNEIVGLLGDNGAGKSTLIQALLGLNTMRSGEISFDGQLRRFRSPEEARAAGIETVFQNLAVQDHLSIQENLFLGKEFVKRKGPFHLLDKRRMRRSAWAVLKDSGLDHRYSPDQQIGVLSQGQRQFLEVERAYHLAEKLVILDEPTAGMSDAQIAGMLQMITSAKRQGLSVIFVTHKAHEIFTIADRFVILQHGTNYVNVSKQNVTIEKLEKLMIASRFAAMREMSGAVAHQLRNPLGIIRVSAEVLRDEIEVAKPDDRYHHLLEVILREVRSLETVVRNYLDYARNIVYNKREIAIDEVLNRTVAELELQGHAIDRILCAVDPDVPRCWLDPNLIVQALLNLIDNALLASSSDGTVRVGVSMKNEKLVIEIEDSGVGMETALVERVLHPFVSGRPSGTGLGLSFAQRIVEGHGGTLSIESV